MTTLLYSSQIIGTGSAFPRTRLTNRELAKKVETSHEWIIERTGIEERRISQPGNQDETNSSLGYQASLKALEMAGKSPNDIDQIIYATCTPDTLIPSTACWLQKKLGASRAWAMDINAACSGFVFALANADQWIKTGKSKTVLVVGADILSAFTNWSDRTSCILFGDGAGAVILEQTSFDNPNRILSYHLQSDGRLWDLFYIPAGGSNQEVTPEIYASNSHKMTMKGREIFKTAVRTISEYAQYALNSNGFSVSDLDWFIPHQANLRIIEAVAKRIDLPEEKVLVNLQRYGNTSSATVPSVLDEAVRDGRIREGQLILMAVFGAGLTYGSLLFRMRGGS